VTASALCSHFGTCGGCSLQDLPPADYAAGKRAAIQHVLMRAGVNAEVLAPVIVPPNSRRRAVLKLAKSGGVIAIGFHAAQSHSIVDMHECLVLTPGIFDLLQELRTRLPPLLSEGEKAELHVTETATGFDLAFRSPRKLSSALTTAMAEALAGAGCVRVLFNNEIVLEDAAAAVSFGDVVVKLPPLAFLQPTAQGEAALQARVLGIVGKAKAVADLFAGCGTFALPLARKARVHAVEQDAPALAALAEAAKAPKLKPVTTEVRDLFKLPLTPAELAPYEAVALDPPRAGAESQARALARSRVPVIAYVSCDPASFARDAAFLVAGGYRIGPVTPIDQFLWSSHIELVAGFVRGA
jgi:23S rRNA (uracil1939-C5)-methyltransferase